MHFRVPQGIQASRPLGSNQSAARLSGVPQGTQANRQDPVSLQIEYHGSQSPTGYPGQPLSPASLQLQYHGSLVPTMKIGGTGFQCYRDLPRRVSGIQLCGWGGTLGDSWCLGRMPRMPLMIFQTSRATRWCGTVPSVVGSAEFSTAAIPHALSTLQIWYKYIQKILRSRVQAAP